MFLKTIKNNFLEASEVDIVKDDHRRKNDCHLLQSAHVNIMILGKTGVGKSTFFNLLQDPTIKAIEQSVISQTKDVVFQPFTLNFNTYNLTINLIDTPGVREYKLDETRSDQAITNAIVDCVEKEITRMHVLIICISVTERFTQDDKLALEVLHKNFCAGGKLPMIIVITKAEGQDELWYRKRIFEIKTHPFFAALMKCQDYDCPELRQYQKDGDLSKVPVEIIKRISDEEMDPQANQYKEVAICFAGYVDTTNKKFSSEKELDDLYTFVFAMRKALLQQILDMYSLNKTGLFMSALPYYKMLETETGEVLHDYVNALFAIHRTVESKTSLTNYPEQKKYVELKEGVLRFMVFYDLSVMAAHFALISDILSSIYNVHKIRDEWIFEGFNSKIYENEGSLSRDFLKRIKSLPPVAFKMFTGFK